MQPELSAAAVTLGTLCWACLLDDDGTVPQEEGLYQMGSVTDHFLKHHPVAELVLHL